MPLKPVESSRIRVRDRTRRALAEVRLFSSAWRSSPHKIGAVVPSGRALARLLTRDIGIGTVPIIELGPGTGVVTQALLERGIPEDQLALIEMNGIFAAALRTRFPDARIFETDATSLSHLFDDDELAGAVVSGLPLISMSPEAVQAVLEGAFSVLRPDGAFYQFTYGLWFPVPRKTLRHLGLRAKRVGWAALNFPPASVYRVDRDAA
jgi:phospholipid N-methyltransferase